MNSNVKESLLLLLLIWLPFLSYCQENNVGTPFITHYSSLDYGMHPKNYAITQDQYGVMYIGNEYGVLEYDGSEWKQIHLPNGINATMLKIGRKGQVWLGSEEGIGFLQRTEQGSWNYQGLQLPEAIKTPFTVSGIHEFKESIFFTTENQILQKTGNTLKNSFTSEKGPIEFSNVLENLLLIKTKGSHILTITPDEPHEFILNDLASYTIVEMLPFGDRALVVTANNGLWTIYKNKLSPFQVDFNSLIRQDKLTTAIALKDGNFAMGSYHNGVFVFDKEGRLIHHITKEKGLNSNTVNSLYESSDHNLWVALDNGLAYVELNSAFTKYDESLGFSGMIYSSLIHQGKLYLGTTQGLYVSEWERSNALKDLKFKAVDGIEGQVWALHSMGNQLLCGHETGVFDIVGEKAIRLSTSSRVWTFLESEKSLGNVFVGTLNGIEVFTQKDSKYQLSHKLKDFQESSRILAEDADGTLWVCHGNKGLFHLRLSEKLDKIESQMLYKQNLTQNGLRFTSVVKSQKNGILFSSNLGLYHFNETSSSFVPFTENDLIPKGRPINNIFEDQFGNLWLMIEGGLLLMKLQEDGSYKLLDETYLSKARNVMIGSYEHLYVHDAQNVLIAAQNGMLHLDPTFFRKQHLFGDQKPSSTLIRRIELTGSKDSILFEGIQNTLKSEKTLTLPYSKNSIRFTYATPSYISDQAQQYQFILEEDSYGLENSKWSSWTTLSQKEYTNLREGHYTFRVRGGNGPDQLNNEAQYEFIINPPWYRTYGAYVVYVLLLGGFIFVLVKTIKRKHEKDKERIQEVNDREMREQQLISEKEMMELKNAKLAEEIVFKNKEMASVVMQMTQKNEFLMNLRNKLKQITKSTDGSVQSELQSSIREIDLDMRLDKNWERFQFYFDQVHQDFLERLSIQYPDLSSTTLKLCAFIRIGLSTKEIATLMNISISGAEKRRYRLRKKLDIDQDTNLTSFLNNF